MQIHVTKPLFAWDCLEDSPSLKTVRQALRLIPDAALLAALQQARGKGRDDYPVRVLWGAVLLTVLLRHATFDACLADLRRNAALRELIGITCEERVPHAWNISRFLDVLGMEPCRTLLHQMFDQQIQALGSAVPGLGENTAGDATYLNARRKSPDGAQVEEKSGLPQPAGGRKEYKDEEGKVVEVLEWFGYKLHLIVDVKHEVALAYQVTATGAGDGETLPALLEEATTNLPAGRIQTLAYDKAADDHQVHAALHEKQIKPLIEMRSLWTDELERVFPGIEGRLHLVYDEAGTPYCYDTRSDPPVRRALAFMGHEAARGTLKYRCPACQHGFKCPSAERCNAGKSYGLTLRIKQEEDLRRFPPIPRATQTFERLYKGRTAVERVNARLKVFWGADDGNLTGAQRFYALIGVVMVVHSAFATLLASAPRWEGTLGHTRLGPIQKALRSTA
jgi:hypothetical protein